MNFIEQVDAVAIVEEHVRQLLKLEESQANKLLKRYKEVRQELRDRLDRLPPEKFTAQHMRGVLAQIDAALSAMTDSLKDGMEEAAVSAAMLGVNHQIAEIQEFESEFNDAVLPIDIDTNLVASETSNFLMSKYDSSLDSYGQDVRSSLISVLSNELLKQSPYSTVVQRMGQYFQGEEWKLHRLARTELHHVYSLGKLNGMTKVKDQYLPDLKKTLYHPLDSRTAEDSKYVAKLNLIVPLDKSFHYKWAGKERSYLSPPDRPNDRSILIPFRATWIH